MTTEEYVPSDDQVRGRYCDGTYVQAGHTTEGNEFDAWLARVRRDAWDACYHQMVTAPARGVIVTKKSNPYARITSETRKKHKEG